MKVIYREQVGEAVIEDREKGNRRYCRVEADQETLQQVGSRLRLPISASNGLNGCHITAGIGLRRLIVKILAGG